MYINKIYNNKIVYHINNYIYLYLLKLSAFANFLGDGIKLVAGKVKMDERSEIAKSGGKRREEQLVVGKVKVCKRLEVANLSWKRVEPVFAAI